MKPRVVFRADGSTDLGMGHVVRCLAMAVMLQRDFHVSFALQGTDPGIIRKIKEVSEDVIVLSKEKNFDLDADQLLSKLKIGDIVVLDGYNFNTSYQKKIKSKGYKLVCIDDLHAWPHVADVLINYADGVKREDYTILPGTQLYLGSKYILLRPEFLRSSDRIKHIQNIENVFLSMGASDIYNLSEKFVKELQQIAGIKVVHLLVGSVNANINSLQELIKSPSDIHVQLHTDISAADIVSLIKDCDLAICPASTIALECSSVGIPLISGYTSENQKGILKGLAAHKAVFNLGDLCNIGTGELKKSVLQLRSQPEQIKEQLENQKRLIDGKSPERILELFKKLIPLELEFRFAEVKDVDLYFRWANDPIVRSNSFDQSAVEYERHVDWFNSKLNSEDCYFYLFSSRGIPVGQVRIDKSANEIIIGISIDKKFRGMNAGVSMLKLACSDYFEKNPGSKIAAYIKVENAASYSIFKKAGFGNDEMLVKHGVTCHKLFINP